jgi:hypothetical protein
MTIQEKAEQLLKLRQQINAVKETLIPLQAEKDALEQNLMDHLKKQGFASVKTGQATISIAHRKSLVITDENILVQDLKKRGLNDYIKEAINKELFKGVADQMKKTGELMEGTVLQDTEYMSIREAKEKVK